MKSRTVTLFIGICIGMLLMFGILLLTSNGTKIEYKPIAARSHAIRITRQNTDDRGLTCIQFTQDGQEWALDYLTTQELDSLTSIK